jgi:hypothetical protein
MHDYLLSVLVSATTKPTLHLQVNPIVSLEFGRFRFILVKNTFCWILWSQSEISFSARYTPPLPAQLPIYENGHFTDPPRWTGPRASPLFPLLSLRAAAADDDSDPQVRAGPFCLFCRGSSTCTLRSVRCGRC